MGSITEAIIFDNIETTENMENFNVTVLDTVTIYEESDDIVIFM